MIVFQAQQCVLIVHSSIQVAAANRICCDCFTFAIMDEPGTATNVAAAAAPATYIVWPELTAAAWAVSGSSSTSM